MRCAALAGSAKATFYRHYRAMRQMIRRRAGEPVEDR